MTDLSIETLRQDLRARLAGYKMPTILRIIQGELPKSGTGKVVKKILGPQFFPKNYVELKEVQAWNPKQITAKL
jgi:malonyl-CoA/methylmalonyl-CoA synthetase